MQTLDLSVVTKLNFQKTIWHILPETNVFFLKSRCHAFITNKTKTLEGKFQRYWDLNEYTNYKEGIWISSSICKEKKNPTNLVKRLQKNMNLAKCSCKNNNFIRCSLKNKNFAKCHKIQDWFMKKTKFIRYSRKNRNFIKC